MTDKNEMEDQREKAWEKFLKDKTKNSPSGSLGGVFRGFRCGFNHGYDTKKGLDKEKLIKRIKELDFNRAQGRVLRMIINGDFDEK